MRRLFSASISLFTALIAATCLDAAAWAQAFVASHSINVTIDPATRTVAGVDRIEVKPGHSNLTFLIRGGSSIEKVELDGNDLPFTVSPPGTDGMKKVKFTIPPKAGEPSFVMLYFSGSMRDLSSAGEYIKRGVAHVQDGVIGDDWAYLPASSAWHPQAEGELSIYDVTIRAPKGFLSISSGDWVSQGNQGAYAIDRWKTSKPAEGIDVVSGKYAVARGAQGEVELFAFFFSSDEKLAKLYIDKSGAYIDRYSKAFGEYPFEKFAVVESKLPTGYGMPSFTLLGSKILRLPFIPDTSLGHEIAHNWWGNSVFVEAEGGNWAEPLATYTSDYAGALLEGNDKAHEFRLKKLMGYKNFASHGEVPSLNEFGDAEKPKSRAVGYNKGAMVFLMLEDLIGEEAFIGGLKDFYSTHAFTRASWDDLRLSFEIASGTELGWFFDQWVKRRGAPMIFLEDAKVRINDDGEYSVKLRIRQRPPAYRLKLPVQFVSLKGETFEKTVEVDGEVDVAEALLRLHPVSVEIDPGHRNFRLLSDSEVPPTLGAFFGDPIGVVVVPSNPQFKAKYENVAKTIAKDFNLRVAIDNDVIKNEPGLKYNPLFILGGPGENAYYWQIKQHVAEHIRIRKGAVTIDGKTFNMEGSIIAVALRHPQSASETICILMADVDQATLDANGARLRYFADSSYVVFTGDKVEKDTFGEKKPLKHVFDY